MARQFIGLCQDATVTELERRMINRYTLACRQAVLHYNDSEYAHWHYLAHIRFKALQRVRHYL